MIGGSVFDEAPDLTPELEWMLHTNQVSEELVAEALVDDYYYKLILLAGIILGDSSSAKNVVIETIYQLIQDRGTCLSDQDTSILVYTRAIKVLHQMIVRAGQQRILSGRLPFLLPHHQGTTAEKDVNPVISSDSLIARLGFKDRAALYFVDVDRLNAEQVSLILKEKRSVTEKRFKLVRTILKNNKDSGDMNNLGLIGMAVLFSAGGLTREVSGVDRGQIVREILKKFQREAIHKRIQARVGNICIGTVALIAVIGLFWLTNQVASRKTPTPLIPERVIITQIIRVPIYITETPVPKAPPTPLNLASDSNDIKAALQQSAANWERLWLDGITIQYGSPEYVELPLIRRDQVWVSQPYDSLIITGHPEQGADQVWFSRDGKVYNVNLRTGNPVLYDFHSNHLPVYSGFADFIFPESEIINSYTYQPLGKEQLASREVLVVEEFNSTGAKTSHLWLDAFTGVILRRIRFAPDENTVIQDRLLLSIAYDVEIPDRLFNRNQLLTHFVGDHLGRSDESSASIRLELDLITRDALKGLISDPLVFDPADSEFRTIKEYSLLSARLTVPFDVGYRIDRNLPEGT
jgi:hypothetical protein